MITNNLPNNLLTKAVVNKVKDTTINYVQKSSLNVDTTLIKTFLLDRDVSSTSHKLAQQKAEKLIDRIF